MRTPAVLRELGVSCRQQEPELHCPKGHSLDAPKGNKEFWDTTLLHFTAFLLAKTEGRKTPDICIKISSFYYIPHNTSSKNFKFPQDIFHTQATGQRWGCQGLRSGGELGIKISK